MMTRIFSSRGFGARRRHCLRRRLTRRIGWLVALSALLGATLCALAMAGGSREAEEHAAHVSLSFARFYEVMNPNETVDPYRYAWVRLERSFCTRRHPRLFLLIVVHTAIGHFKERQAIREMWGHPVYYHKFRTAVVFALGASQNETLMEMTLSESNRYRDIIQQNFDDKYHHLTLKAIMWLRFAAEYCPLVPYILKIDDDITFNYFALLHLLHMRSREPFRLRGPTVLCLVWYRMLVVRDNRSKWYIPEKFYPQSTYPPYCSGSAYILTGDLARPMLRECRQTRHLHIDDLYITGILGARVGAQLESIAGAYYLAEPKRDVDRISKGHSVFALSLSINDRKAAWKRLVRQYHQT